MKALFLKEWRQNYLLFLFSLIMVGFLPAMYALLTKTWVRDWRDQMTLNDIVGVAYVVVCFIIVLFGGAGLIAGETERGTLPVLLGLPLSRAQVWFAKLAAGLTMTITGLALVLGSGAAVLPQCFDAVDWATMWRDLSVLLTLGFFLGFFWSAVLNRTISALLATIISGPALFVADVIFIMFFGASLFGGNTPLDVWLWMLAAIPGMLLGSYMTFSRSGIETRRRKWRTGMAWTAVGLFLTGAAIVVPIRWDTRYRRSEAAAISPLDIPSGGTTMALLTQTDRVVGPSPMHSVEYRSQHTVVVDLKTCRELLVRRGWARAAAVSRDGKMAALATGFPTLTWRSSDLSSSEVRGVEIWDLARGKLLYRGLPSEFWKHGRVDIQEMEWSPDGEWLLMGADIWDSALDRIRYLHEEPGFQSSPRALLLMRRDGTDPTVIECHGGTSYREPAYGWDLRSGRHGVYVFGRDGDLLRHDLDTAKVETVWGGLPKLNEGSAYGLGVGRIWVSPDGQTIMVLLAGSESERGRPGLGSRFIALAAVAADGSDTRSIYDDWIPDEEKTPEWWTETEFLAAWSGDSMAFCLVTSTARYGRSPVPSPARVLCWKRGQERATMRQLAETAPVYGLLPYPGSDLFVTWGTEIGTAFVDRYGHLQPLPERLQLLAGGNLLDFDAQDRAILYVYGEKTSGIAALDINTGKLTDIYP